MYKKGAGNDKQRKDAGNRTLCPYRNFSQAINPHTAREIPYSPGNSIQPGEFHTSTGCPAPMFAESIYRVNTTNKLKQCGSRKAMQRDY